MAKRLQIRKRAAAAGVLLFLPLVSASLGAGLATAAPAGNAAAPVQFDRQIAPLLASHCLECHNGSNAQGGLDLTRSKTARSGGARGPAVVPGKPDASWLWKRVAADQMPPKRPLSAAEKAVLKQWIASGAAWGTDPIDPFRYTTERRAGTDWWSLQPLSRPGLPAVKRKEWASNPIDRFVLSRLERAGLQPSPPADRITLVRRVYFDMLGLPPSPEEVDRFVKDRAPGAYERLVDRVLASPHYGERWARHWLDVVRYAESQGFERNKLRPNAWKYRDWVVDALNSDLPYDEFVRLQVAGDVLRPDDPLAVIASGFLVMGPYDLTAHTTGTAMMQAAARQEELEGLVGTVGQTFLGLTVNCARCHDHKFDPIPTKEYYQIAAALGGTYHGPERESLTPAGKERAQADHEALKAELAAGRAHLESRVRLLSGGPVHVPVPKEPGVFHILARGDWRQKGEAVAPAGIAALSGPSADWGLKPDAPEAERRKALAAWLTDPRNPLTPRVIVNRVWGYHFGEGLVPTPSDLGFNGGLPSHPELLDWLASWFASPAAGSGQYGSMGAREYGGGNPPKAQSRTPDANTHTPTRPNPHTAPLGANWSIKQLHRLILTSSTYRQSSYPPPRASGAKPAGRDPRSIDGDNRLLWRQRPRRLEAEALRDAVLAVSGDLDRRLGGPGFRDWTVKTQGENDLYTVGDGVGPEFNRRTLYRATVRAGTSPFLDVLDCPDPSVAAPRRSSTTTPLQALSLLNHRFMEHAAGRWKERLVRETPGSLRGQVARAYRLAFARDAREDELRLGERLAAEHGLEQLCLVLLNANEFLYVD